MTKKKSKIHIGDVKGDVIISQDQSGGTTAHESRTTNDKKPTKSKYSIITIISIAMLILAILTYLDVKPIKENKMPKDEEDKISIGDVNGEVVISQNQSGGITAGYVNFGPINVSQQVRHLDSAQIEEIKKNIPDDTKKKIVICCPIGDSEAHEFASEIKKHLESRGLKVDSFKGIIPPPSSGQQVKITDDSIIFLIGTRK